MKILFPLGTLYPSQAGGPSNTIYWLAKALVKKGIDVSIVTTHIGAENKVTANKALETEYGKVTYFSDNIDQLPFQMMVNALRQVLHHDCIHLTSIFYPPSFIVATAAKWLKKPVIWSCRGNLHPHALQISTWKKKPVLWYIKKYLAGPDVTFHTTSVEESAHIRRIFGPGVKIVEIPNYIELPEKRSPIEEEPPYLLYVGRIHPIKALDNLLSALNISEKFRRSNLVLKISGDDNNDYAKVLKRQALEWGLSDRIQFLGQIEGGYKQQLYASAKFTILPSFSENFGNVVVESLAQGTPVIASTGTPWQILEMENAGFWTENDPEALSRTIDRALNLSPDEYTICRHNSYTLVKKYFDVSKNIENWINVYQTIYSTQLVGS